MPRTNPGRTIEAEEYLAERIAYERERRGWSYDTLARRMAEVGCPIQASALYKVEKAKPRRTIYVNELVALSQVFEVSPSTLTAHKRPGEEPMTRTDSIVHQLARIADALERSSPPPETHTGTCPSTSHDINNTGLLECVRTAGHDGHHQDQHGTQWSNRGDPA